MIWDINFKLDMGKISFITSHLQPYMECICDMGRAMGSQRFPDPHLRDMSREFNFRTHLPYFQPQIQPLRVKTELR